MFLIDQGQLTPKSAVEFCRNSNSSKLLWLSSLPTRMKKIQSKMKALECYQDFPHYKHMGFFFRRSRAATSAVPSRIWPKFELISRYIIVVLITCKYEEDPIKNKGARMLTRFHHYNPMGAIGCHGNQSSDPIWPKTYCSLSSDPMMLQIKFGYD